MKFYRDVELNDRVLASSGKRIYGLGTVKGDNRYDDGFFYSHSKPVRWELTFWDPLNIEEQKEQLGLPEELTNRIRRNRTILELNKIGIEQEWVGENL